MCFDTDSLPPIPVISGAAVSHDDLVLEAADGNRFAAFAASPEEPGATGIVILPDVRGLYRFYEELALRLAERGHAAVAFDYFEYMEHVKATTPEGIQADVGACVTYLRDHGATAIFTVGFCMGGRQSWLASAAGHGLAGAVGFYGRPPLEDAPRMRGPLLALQAGADAHITAEDNAGFDAALTAAGVDHELVEYEGAPHSFFDRKQEEFQDASDDAWRRTLELIANHR